MLQRSTIQKRYKSQKFEIAYLSHYLSHFPLFIVR